MNGTRCPENARLSVGGAGSGPSSSDNTHLQRNTSVRLRPPSLIASSQGEGGLAKALPEFSTVDVGSKGCDGLVSPIDRAIVGYYSRFMGCCGRVSLN